MNNPTMDHPVAAPTSERRVLVVDDEPEIAEQIVRYLGRHGFFCLSAADGKEALGMAEGDPLIAVVITDVRMPGRDGLDLAAELRRRIDPQRHLEVIIMTGFAGVEHAIRAVHLGARDFLTKPLSLQQLLETVRGADEAVRARQLEAQYNRLLRDEVARRDDQVRRLTERLRGLEIADADNAILYLREILLPGLTEELSPAIDTAHAMVELLREEGNGGQGDAGEQIVTHLAVAVKEARRCVATVSDLSRALTGGVELMAEPVTLQAVLIEAVERASTFAEAGGISIQLPDHLVAARVSADRAWLTRACVHLLETACNLSPFGGAVRLSMRPAAQTVEIRFEVVGAGTVAGSASPAMPEAPASNRTGLGYALARRVLLLMGGEAVFDIAPDGTPSFLLTLRLAS